MRSACEYCGTITHRDAESYRNCDASLPTATVDEATISEQEPENLTPVLWVTEPNRIETCLVCSLEISFNDSVASCPHCGNVFDKTHLFEWVKKKKGCPVCGGHLNQKEITEQPPHASGQ